MKLRISAGGASFEVVVYGRTPISTDERPKLAARCNVVGRLENPAALANIPSGEKISVSRA